MRHHPFITYQLRKHGEKPQHGVLPVVHEGRIIPDGSQPEQYFSYSYQESNGARLGVLALESTLTDVPPTDEAHMLLSMFDLSYERPPEQRIVMQKTGLYTFYKPADEEDPVQRYWVTLPSIEQINNRIARLNRGFLPGRLALPSFAAFYGDEYTDTDFVNKYSRHGKPLLSTGRIAPSEPFHFTYFAHDLIEHFPDWLTSHPQTRAIIRERARRAQNDSTGMLGQKLLFDVDNGMSFLGITQAHVGSGADPHNYIAELVGRNNVRQTISASREHLTAIVRHLKVTQPFRSFMQH